MKVTEVLKKAKEITWNNKKWILVSILLFVFIVIAQNVLAQERFVMDSNVYQFLVANRSDVLTNIFKVITNLGGAYFLIGIAIICCILIKNKKYKVTIPLNLVVIAVINFLLKNVFNRQRPNELRIIEESGFSFPSGHSMASMAFYGYLIYIIYKNVENKKLRAILCTSLAMLILMIGLSRIYLGVHYTSDVLAGFCLSMIYLIIMINLRIYK